MKPAARRPRSHSVALAATLLLAACGDGSTGPQPVASVDVSPPSVTLAAGQVVSLAATPRDASGNALPDRELTWSADDPTVASVDANGTVTGVGAGTTQIHATSEGVGGASSVTVQPPPVAAVEVLPAQVSLLPGETAQLTATARDAQDNVLAGQTFSWVSDDQSVATVDQAGLVTSVAPGAASIFAISGGRSGSSAVGVDDPNAARVLSVDPAVIVEGQPATIGGANFSGVVAEDVVTIDGVRATVTGATPTTLDIVVPDLGCHPRHTADVAVTVAGHTAHRSHPASPATFFTATAGQLTLLQDPTKYCLTFDSASADEEYLIGVQSTAPQASTVTFADVVGEAEAAASPATLASPLPSAGFPSGGPGIDQLGPTDERVLQWREREAEVMAREIDRARRLGTAKDVGPLRTGPAMIPGTVTPGTKVTIRYSGVDENTCSDYVELSGTVRYVTASGIWVSDDANPPNGFTDADYQTLGDQFESVIYPHQTGYFGAPADVDGNGRIVMVVTKEVNDDGIGGIVPSTDLYPQQQCAASNYGEYFYMFAPDPTGQYADGVISVLYALNQAPLIIGHELVHNIQLSRRFTQNLSFWESWQLEGQAVLGEEVLGHFINGRSSGQDYGWSIVRNDPPTASDGRAWTYDGFRGLFLYYGWQPLGAFDPQSTDVARVPNAPENCTFLDTPTGTNAGVCARRGLLVYGVTWSFLRWLTDQYAADFPGGEAEMHQTWLDGPGSGFASIEALVGEPIETLLARWAASLYLDNRGVTGLDPFLTLPSYDLSDIEDNVVPEARLQPRVRAFSDFNQSVQVRAGSTAYFLVSGADRPSTAIRVRSPSGGYLSPSTQIWVVRTR